MAKNSKQRKSDPVPAFEWFAPLPGDGEVRALMDLYLRRTGEEIEMEAAREALTKIVRFQYAIFRINTEGLPPAGPVPLGYRAAEDGRWEEDPHDGPLVRRAFELRAAGATIRAVCAEMAAAGLRSRRGKAIGPSSMLKLLGNRTYLAANSRNTLVGEEAFQAAQKPSPH